MALRETGVGVFASAMLAMVALPLVACGESNLGSGGSAGSSGSSGSNGGSRGGSDGAGGGAAGSATGGSAPTAGSGADAGRAGAASSGNVGGGCAGGAEVSASLCWIEATEAHRERAASSTKPASLQTRVVRSFDSSVLIGTSTLTIGEDERYTEGFVWSEASGTTSLGGLPGANRNLNFSVLSDPRAVSADGSVVVGVAADSQNRPTPFRWTRADGMEAIAEYGTAIAVSADGAVVLGQQDPPLARGFRWTRARGAVIFEPLPGDVATGVFALSADGATVLGNSFRSDGSWSLFVWTEASGVRVVDNLPGYTGCLAGLELTHGFIVAGSCYDQTGRSEPYIWMGQDHLLALGPADALGDYHLSGPIAVSVDGSVAVGRTVAVENVSRLYRWTQTGGFELIELPEGYTSNATAPEHRTMSDDGAVVVGWLSGIARHSFLWSEGAGTVVLSPLDGHDVSEVWAVSADGTVAVGRSFRLSSLGEIADWTAVYWRADGVPHRIADELRAEGVDVGRDAIGSVYAAYSPLGVFGYGRKDEVSVSLGWRARFPERLNAVAQ